METLLAFWLVSIFFVFIPGLDWAYAIAAGIGGRVAVSVLGLLVGHTITIIIVAVGFGTLVSNLPGFQVTLTILGSGYLIWIGIQLFFNPSEPPSASIEMQKNSNWFLKGVGVSGLNPKVYFLILALLPQFVDTHSAILPSMQMLILGIVHLANCALVYFAVGLVAERVRRTRPKTMQFVSRASGILMICLAIALLIEQVLKK